MRREIEIRQADSFTSEPMGGNPAGVVASGAESLTGAQMQAIAREMNVAETAFLLPPEAAGADVRIRWFTPSIEVDLCGHATVAAFHVAAEEGLWGLGAPGKRDLVVESRSGLLPLEVTVAPGERPAVRMGLPDPRLEAWDGADRALAALGVPREALDPALPCAASGFFVLLLLRSIEALRALRPAMGPLRDAIAAREGADALVAASLETIDPASAIHLRMFAPGAGIDEDPVTGSAQGPVAAWLAASGRLVPGAPGRARALPGGRVGYTAEQGDLIGRRGRVEVDLALERVPEGENGAAGRWRARDVRISGSALTVLRGRILVP